MGRAARHGPIHAVTQFARVAHYFLGGGFCLHDIALIGRPSDDDFIG